MAIRIKPYKDGWIGKIITAETMGAAWRKLNVNEEEVDLCMHCLFPDCRWDRPNANCRLMRKTADGRYVRRTNMKKGLAAKWGKDNSWDVQYPKCPSCMERLMNNSLDIGDEYTIKDNGARVKLGTCRVCGQKIKISEAVDRFLKNYGDKEVKDD